MSSAPTDGGVPAWGSFTVGQCQPCNTEHVPDLEIEGTLFCFNLSLVQHHAVTLGGLSRMCVTGPARADRKNSITAVQLFAV